jgi:hypothetical protein
VIRHPSQIRGAEAPLIAAGFNGRPCPHGLLDLVEDPRPARDPLAFFTHRHKLVEVSGHKNPRQAGRRTIWVCGGEGKLRTDRPVHRGQRERNLGAEGRFFCQLKSFFEVRCDRGQSFDGRTAEGLQATTQIINRVSPIREISTRISCVVFSLEGRMQSLPDIINDERGDKTANVPVFRVEDEGFRTESTAGSRTRGGGCPSPTSRWMRQSGRLNLA